VLVVTHNFPILALLCRITETPLNQYRAFHVEPCGLTRIGYEADRGWRLLSADDNGQARDLRKDPQERAPGRW
jgi:broad specificity phosphatase PhoE